MINLYRFLIFRTFEVKGAVNLYSVLFSQNFEAKEEVVKLFFCAGHLCLPFLYRLV